MMERPVLDILIANYNNGRFFKDTYQSLINQTDRRWQAIVIDDCSKDDSVSLIKNLIKNDHRFKFYENPENRGYQRTILKAISLSAAPLFGRLDPDDTLERDAVKISIETHLQNPEAGLAYSDINVCDEDLNLKWIITSTQISALDEHYLNLNSEISPFATFKRRVYDKTSGIDPTIIRAEDKDIYMKMCEIAPVVYIPMPLYNYRHIQGSLSTGDNELRAYYWHWAALVKMMERRKINVEDAFVKYVADRSLLNDAIEQRDRQLSWFRQTWLRRQVAKMINRYK